MTNRRGESIKIENFVIDTIMIVINYSTVMVMVMVIVIVKVIINK